MIHKTYEIRRLIYKKWYVVDSENINRRVACVQIKIKISINLLMVYIEHGKIGFGK